MDLDPGRSGDRAGPGLLAPRQTVEAAQAGLTRVPEAESANQLFNEFTTTKMVWLVVIVACTAAVVIRGLRRRRRERDGKFPET